MSKFGEELIEAMTEAVAIARGEKEPAAVHVVMVPDDIDVKAIRKATGLSQKAFADKYGVAYDALRDWEAKRRRPDRTARILLRVIEREPEAVERALSA